MSFLQASRPRLLLPALCVTAVVSWGSLYYAFAELMRPIRADMQWGAQATMGAYSLALLVSGLCAYPVGRTVERGHGRWVMTLGSGLAGLLFLALGGVESISAFYAVWAGLGVAMAMTLYEPAFGVLVSVFERDWRKKIGLLTLAGGLASTVFWPLTHVLVSQLGWRGCAVVLGAMHLLLCVPLHVSAIPSAGPKTPPQRAESPGPVPAHSERRSLLRTPSFWLLGTSFTAFGFVTSALAVHAIALIESRGWSPAEAVALAAFIGPMQTAGRAAELVFGHRIAALSLGLRAVWLTPLGLLALLFAPAQSALIWVFVLLHGAGLGLSTIVRATTPAEMFGRERYASNSGALATPSLAARAVGPLAATQVLGSSGPYGSVLLLLLAVAAAGAVSYGLAVAVYRRG